MPKRKCPEETYIDELRDGKRKFGISDRSASLALGKKDKNGAGGSFDYKGSKMWYATNETVWLKMFQTGMWLPTDTAIDAGVVARMIREKRQAVARAIEEATTRQKPSEEQREVHIRRELLIPSEEPHIVAELEALGISKEIIEMSGKWTILGPRSGISNSYRIQRGIKLGVTTAEKLRAMNQ